MLSYGVTAVLSMGTDQDLIFQIRDAQHAGRPTMTRVFTAGQGFVFKGGYGGLAGVTPGVSTVAEVEPAVAAQAAKHVDIIKLWVDDHLHTQKKMPYDIAQAIIESAHKHQLRAAAHIFYLEDAKKLTEFGVNGLAHSVRDKPVDDELIAQMKKHGTWQMAATLTREASMFVYGSTPAFVNDPFFTRGVPASVVRDSEESGISEDHRTGSGFSRISRLLRDCQAQSQKTSRCRCPVCDSAPTLGRRDGFRDSSNSGKWN